MPLTIVEPGVGGTGVTTSTGTGSTVLSNNPTLAGITDSGNLTFTGTGNRITGDMSNATIPSRLAFQTSGANLSTVVTVIPNGSGTAASLNLESDSALTTGHVLSLSATTGETRLNSAIRGAGSYVPLTMYTGGSERLRIDTSGNVGIGTSSPTAPLTVVAPSNGLAFAINGRSSDNLGGLYFYANNGTTSHCQITASATEYRVASQSTAVQTFYTNSSERMRIDSSGNVGIGVSSPAQKLDVYGSARLTYSGGNNYVEFESASNYVGRNSSGNMILNAAGGNNVLQSVGGTTITQATGAGLFQFNSGYGSVATAYGCRAWVNFDGNTGGAPSIRASGGVSSVSRSATGKYTINFSFTMPDSNYSIAGTAANPADVNAAYRILTVGSGSNNGNDFSMTTTSCNVQTQYAAGNQLFDCNFVLVSIFR